MDRVERVTKLRRFTRGDERAAHKPLLLLYALGRFQHYGDAPVGSTEAEKDLAGLLKEFGPRFAVGVALVSGPQALQPGRRLPRARPPQERISRVR